MTARKPQGGLLDRIAHAAPRETPNPRDILSSLGEVIYDWDLTSDRMRWGPNAEEVLGFPEEDVATGTRFASRITPESCTARPETIAASRERDRGSGVKYQFHYSLLSDQGGGERFWVEDVGRWFAGPDGRPARAHGVIRIVNRSPKDDERPAQLLHDPLTGTLSRSRFIEIATRMFADAGRSYARGGLLLIAVDELSKINQIYGYEIADQAIAGVARYLRRTLRAGDLIARYAGNKFAVALANSDKDQLAATARRCIEGMTETALDTDAGPIRITLRIGGVVASLSHGANHCPFLQAEEALNAARAPGAPRYVAHEPNAAKESARQHVRRVAKDIVSALNERRVFIAIEPIVEAETARVAFSEVLMRMRMDDGSILAPADVFSVAEKAGLAPLLDQRIMELTIDRLAADPSLQLSVNVSGLSFREADWIDSMSAALRSRPGCAERLIIEITETCAIEDIDAAGRTIQQLKELGVRVAMDDFGAGHTSFKNLRSLNLDLVKIDGAFIQNLTHSADDRFFVRTLVELARHVDVPTVAEWVADQESADLLKQWGVAYFQGELFGRAELLEPLASAAAA